MFATFIGKLLRKPGALAGLPRQAWSGSTQLQLEALEDRAVPSALMMEPALPLDGKSPEGPQTQGGKIGDGMNDGDDFMGRSSLELMGGKIGDGTNGGDDFTGSGSVDLLGGKIGDGINDGDDYTGRGLLQDAINLFYGPRGGEEIPT